VTGVSNKNLVLAAMVFAVAMTFIDQTIVAIAVPDLQKDLTLSATGSQWIINAYLLSLSALFALGGKLGDVLGRGCGGRSSGSTSQSRSSRCF
jgi:MFS family permease